MKHFVVPLFLIMVLTANFARAEKTIVFGLPFKVTRNIALIQFHSFIEEALNDVGYKMATKTIPTKSTYQMLVDGDVDAITYDDLSEKKNRGNIVSMSFPFVLTRALIFYRKNLNNFTLENLQHFHGTIPQNNLILQKEAAARKLKFKIAASPSHCLQMVLNHQSDYFIALEEIGAATLNAYPNAEKQVEVFEAQFMSIPVYISFKKSWKDDLPKIEESFRKHLKGDLSHFPLIEKNLNKNP